MDEELDGKKVVKALASLQGNDRLDLSHLRNGDVVAFQLARKRKDMEQRMEQEIDFNDQRWHGGGSSSSSSGNQQGTTVASATNLVLDSATGNSFEITGTTTIDHINTVGWQNGSIITLFNSEGPIQFTNKVATSGTNVTLAINGGTQVFDANAYIQFILFNLGGTQEWRSLIYFT